MRRGTGQLLQRNPAGAVGGFDVSRSQRSDRLDAE